MSVSLVLINNDSYSRKIYDFLKESAKISEKTLFVSLNKPFGRIRENFSELGIDISRFFVIDAITSAVTDPEPAEGCLFSSTPQDLNFLFLEIITTIRAKKIKTMIFDSLSSLNVYQDTIEIYDFFVKLIDFMGVYDYSIIFTCLKSDEGTDMIRYVKMKADKISEIK